MFENIVKPIKAISGLLKSKPITFMFPPEMPLTEGFRGRHFFDEDKCRSCRLCERICPNNAIVMVERERDGKKVFHPQIDYSKCCFCGLCVDVCPSKALTFTNFPFLVVFDKKELLYPPDKLGEKPALEMPSPPKIKSIVDWGRSRSLWVLNYMTGCCFIEAVPWVSSGFDMERFGLIAVGSPRHADVLIVGGYVTVKTLRRIIRVYQQMAWPKFVLALGNCPMTGGTYWDSYNTIKNLDKYIPVDVWIAGCPPRPEPIGLAIVEAMFAVQSGYTGKEEKVNKEGGLLEVPPLKEEAGPGEIVLPFGPCHPASGNFDIILRVDGEKVLEAKPNPGYLHRGFEKLMEYRTWWQNIMIVQRVCVLDGASYELAYIGAVEKIAGINVPRRASYLRTIQGELSRIQSHLLNLGFLASATGFRTVMKIAWGDREKILYLLEKLTGARIYHIYNIPGGVRRDMPEDFKSRALEILKYMRKRLKVYDDLCFNNQVFIERTKNIGVLDSETAIRLDVTGPNIRGSGVDFDLRKTSPYEAFDEIEFNVAVGEGGDCYSRALCRRMEMEESLNIIEECLERIPGGPIAERKMKNGRVITPFGPIPEGESLHCIESARGELCFHAISDGKPRPYRVKIRGPTFDNILVAMPRIMSGVNIADIPVIYWSLDNCPADHDR